ncbi:MAG: hypothetical protein IPG26_07795 [Coprothermobacter sp.]|nr:hypothetical protein [Coprothermobacter sp.]
MKLWLQVKSNPNADFDITLVRVFHGQGHNKIQIKLILYIWDSSSFSWETPQCGWLIPRVYFKLLKISNEFRGSLKRIILFSRILLISSPTLVIIL